MNSFLSTLELQSTDIRLIETDGGIYLDNPGVRLVSMDYLIAVNTGLDKTAPTLVVHESSMPIGVSQEEAVLAYLFTKGLASAGDTVEIASKRLLAGEDTDTDTEPEADDDEIAPDDDDDEPETEEAYLASPPGIS